MLYSLGFILSLAGLMGLMLDREEVARLRFALLPGLGIWLIGTMAGANSVQSFLGQSFTDLLFLGGAALVFRALAQSGRFAIVGSIAVIMAMIAFH